MSEAVNTGILYTEHSSLRSVSLGVSSLWSYESRSYGGQRPVAVNADGDEEYWLDRSDPLLNTILPGTGVSLVVNLDEPWTAGRTLVSSAFVPRLAVIGPVMYSRILRLGNSVRAFGAGLESTLTREVFGVPAAELVDQIAPLEDLWNRLEIERLIATFASADPRQSISVLRNEMTARIGRLAGEDPFGRTVPALVKLQGGQMSINHLAESHGLKRQQFKRRFLAATGLSPKTYARLTRFQALVHSLLSTDVSSWVAVSSDVGFYDQAHMINEFHEFAGSSPTVLFQPHGSEGGSVKLKLRGRPSEWSRLS